MDILNKWYKEYVTEMQAKHDKELSEQYEVIKLAWIAKNQEERTEKTQGIYRANEIEHKGGVRIGNKNIQKVKQAR